MLWGGNTRIEDERQMLAFWTVSTFYTELFHPVIPYADSLTALA